MVDNSYNVDKLFDFYTKYDISEDKIISLSNNEIICYDQNLNEFNIPIEILNKLNDNGIDKLSRLIIISNSFLEYSGFSSEEISILFDLINNFFEMQINKKNELQYNENITDVKKELLIVDEDLDVKIVDNENKEALINLNSIPLEYLNLSVRSYNRLKKNGINYLDELLRIDFVELRKINGLGYKSYKEIISIINKYYDGSLIINKNTNYDLLVNTDDDLIDESEYFSTNIMETDDKKDSSNLINVPLKYLNLSVRSYNKLKEIGINDLDGLLKIKEIELRKINGLGDKSIKEIEKIKSNYYDGSLIINKNFNDDLTINGFEDDDIISSFFNPKLLKIEDSYIYLNNFDAYVYDDNIEKIIIDENFVKILLDINIKKLSDILQLGIFEISKIKGIGKTKFVNIFLKIKVYLKNNIISQDNIKSVNPNEILLYIESFKFDGISREEVINIFSEKYSKDDVVSGIEFLIETKEIFIYEDDKLFYKYISFPKFLYQKKNELSPQLTDIMFSRIDGKTLEEIAQKNNVTRELIRQKVSKFFKNYVSNNNIIFQIFREDKYAYLFQNYYISKKDFVEIFNEKERTFNYLNMRYQHGNTSLSKALDDDLIWKRHRTLIQVFFDRDSIFIDNKKIPKDKKKLFEYYLSKNVLAQTHINEIVDGFNEFIKQYDESFQIIGDEHIRESYIGRIENVISSLYKKYRFYNFSLYDWDSFLEEVNLESYENLNIYSTLLFRKHHNLMIKYDIIDCYELHNILRKLYKDKNDKIIFSRMPSIIIGDFNKKEYMISILEEYGELSANDFIKILDERLGIDKQAINWIIELEEYKTYGKYIYQLNDVFDVKMFEIFKNILNQPFYFKYEIEEILKKIKLNYSEIKNLYKIYKELDYQVYSSYILKKPLKMITYLRDLILENDIIDYITFNKFKYLQTFYDTFAKLKANYDIIQFSENLFINFRKLQALGILKEDLFDYCEDVITNVGNEYFTINFLEKLEFHHKLEKLGFDNIFYESILIYHPKLESFKLNNVYVFKVADSAISKTTFISDIIYKYRFIETDDLLMLFKDKFGIIIDLTTLKMLIENTNIYYNSIMDTFYMDYNVFLEEV